MLESPGHGGNDDHSEPHSRLRLRDAEGIAAARIEGAAEGSLKEAIAPAATDQPPQAELQPADPSVVVGADVAPEDSPEPILISASADEIGGMRPELADQIEAVREDIAVPAAIEEGDAFLAAGANGAPASETANPIVGDPIVGELPELSRRIEAVGASVAAGSLVRLIEARLDEAGRPQNPEPAYACSSTHRPPALDVSVALVKAAESAPPLPLAVLDPAEAHGPGDDPIEQRSGVDEMPPVPEHAAVPEAPVRSHPPAPADDAAPIPADASPAGTSRAPAQPADVAAPQNLQPLASALDAAVQLAADASVAAEALESLKRLLEHKQQLETHLPPPSPEGMLRPASQGNHALAAAPAAPTRLRPQPMPLPLHPQPEIVREPSRAMLPALRPRPAPERRGLDVRGFLAGFALSWAVGVVLYLFLTAG